MFTVAIFLYITVILNKEFLRKIFTMNQLQAGPSMEKCRLDDLLSELGFSSEQFSPEYQKWNRTDLFLLGKISAYNWPPAAKLFDKISWI